MRRRLSFVLLTLLALAALISISEGASFTWTSGSALAVDSRGEPLWGTSEFGAQPDLSLGALVQLWKAVGEIDDPTGNPDAYRDLNWHIDDVLLDEAHMGFGGWIPNGRWHRYIERPVMEDDVFYARAYNVSKPDFASTPIMERELTIRNREGEIVFDTFEPVSVSILHFPNLQTRPIPEPSAVLLVIPVLAVWAMKKRH